MKKYYTKVLFSINAWLEMFNSPAVSLSPNVIKKNDGRLNKWCVFLFLMVAFFISTPVVKAATVTWSLIASPGSGVAAPVNANINISDVFVGTNFNTTTFGATDGMATAGGGALKGWNESNQTNAIANLAFIEFGVTVLNCSTSINITGISFTTKTSAGTIPTGNSLFRYSTDNFLTSFNVGANGQLSVQANTTGNNQTYGGLNISCPANKTITFRLYGWGIGNNNSALSILNFVITGTYPAQAIAPVITVNNNVCNPGSANGQATAAGAGGTGPYTYSWNTVPVQNGATATGLAAGPYTVTVTGSNGCTGTKSVTIQEPPSALSLSCTGTNHCFGLNNGEVTTMVTDGVTPYTYSWSNNSTNPSISGLSSGTYTVTVTDSLGCQDICSQPVNSLPVLYLGDVSSTPIQQSPVCYNEIPSPMSVTGAVGSGSFTYAWYSNSGIVSCPVGPNIGTWIPVATGPTYTPTAGLTSSTTYACFVTPGPSPTCNPAGWANNCVQIEVLPPLDYGQVNAGDQTLCSGDKPDTINVSGAAGASNFNYKWYSYDGIAVCPTGTAVPPGWSVAQPLPNNQQSFTPPVLTSSKTYACLVTPAGSATCGTANWADLCRKDSVNIPSSVSNVQLSAQPQVICNGDSSFLSQQNGTLGTSAKWKWYKESSFSNLAGTSLAADAGIYVYPTNATTAPLTQKYYLRIEETESPCPAILAVTSNTEVTVNPVPDMATVSSQIFCSGAQVTSICFSSNYPDIDFYWSYNQPPDIGLNPPFGLTQNCTPAFTAENLTDTQVVANFTVVPKYNNAGVTCPGTGVDFAITVIPTPPKPDISAMGADIMASLCGGSEYISLNIDSNPYVNYYWAADTSLVTMQSDSSANALFTFINTGSNHTATITAYSYYNSSSGGCIGDSTIFNITISAEDIIDEKKIILKQPGSLLIYLDNTVEGYQWGYDDTADYYRPKIIPGQVYQVMALDKNSPLFLTMGPDYTLNTMRYFFWVMVYKANCFTKVYYNGPYARPAGSSPPPVSDEIKAVIFPNPGNGAFELSLSGYIYGNIKSKIINCLGQEFYSHDLVKTNEMEKYKFSVPDLSQGIYQLQLIGEQDKKISVKFLIY